MTPIAWALLALGLIVIAAVAYLSFRLRRTQALRHQFGPEYDNLVRERGNTAEAERELDHRAKRVDRFAIHSLRPDEVRDFEARWRHAQERFVDEPRAALAEAAEVLHSAMQARGYPAEADFVQRADDLSVNHPNFVSHYRDACGLTALGGRESISTEDMRVAMQHYHALFEDLLEQRQHEPQEVKI
jgi:hypothetical protein